VVVATENQADMNHVLLCCCWLSVQLHNFWITPALATGCAIARTKADGKKVIEKSAVLLDVTLLSLVGRYKCWGGRSCFHLWGQKH